MKIKNEFWDKARYYIFCVITFGMACLLRIIISEAIRMSISGDDE